MQRPVIGLAVGTAALAVLTIMQCSLWRQQSKTNATLARLAEVLEGSGRDEGRPSVNYQLKMNGGVGKDELRAIIREELLASRPAAAETSSREPTTAPAEAAATPVNQQAFQNARRLVDHALASRVWGEQQASELGALRRQLSAEQFEALMADLMPAVNRQEVRVEVAGPLF